MTMSKITPSIRQVVGGKVAALQALGFNSVVTSEKLLRDERPSRLASILVTQRWGDFFSRNCQLKAWVDWIAWIPASWTLDFHYCTCICSAIQLVHVSPCEAFSFRKRFQKRNMFYNGATAERVACWGNEWSSMAGTLWEAFQYNF